MIGLGVRARTVVVGVEQVRSAVRKGGVALAVIADDASAHSRKKVMGLLAARGVRVASGVSAEWLGETVGRDTTAAVAVVDGALARGIAEALGSETGSRPNGGMG